MKTAVDHVSAGPGFAMQCVLSLILFGICRCVTGIASDLQYPVFSPAAQAAGRKLTASVFQHLLNLDITFHLDNQTGRLSSIIERGTRSMQILFVTLFFRVVPTVLETVLVCALFGRVFSPLVSAILLLTLTVYITYSILTVGISINVRKRMIELESLQMGKAVDALQNFETVSLFNNQKLEVHQYDGLLEGYQKASIAHERIMAMLNSGQGFIISVGITLALAVTVMMTPRGSPLLAGDLVLMQGVISQLMVPLTFFGWFYRESRQGLTDLQEFLQILNTEPKMKDGTIDFYKATKYPEMQSANDSHQQGIEVSIKDLHFSYTPERKVLKGINLEIPSGKSVAFVGGSGSGKSTLLKLIIRLYDADKGVVLFDGLNVKDLTRRSFRSVIGVVPQDTVLFNHTIFQNILYGRLDATHEEVYEAARMAQLDSTIREFPDGYETVVGERGLKLSGGEKQRLAIARAFLRAPRLIVCDEATSALDTSTEKEIMKSLEKLAVGRTSIFVAHRLSTIQNCDKIVVMANGQIVEEGTHKQLMAMEGRYYDMWEAQTKSDNVKIENAVYVNS
eukprot:g2389.t1